MMDFLVVIYRWAKGIFLLQSKHTFANSKDALDFAKANETPDEIKSIKVFDPQGQLVESTKTDSDTYA